jgi:hypothetical protein
VFEKYVQNTETPPLENFNSAVASQYVLPKLITSNTNLANVASSTLLFGGDESDFYTNVYNI